VLGLGKSESSLSCSEYLRENYDGTAILISILEEDILIYFLNLGKVAKATESSSRVAVGTKKPEELKSLNDC